MRNKEQNQKEEELPIVIIGAGLSGLLTGYRLKKAGIPVKILEARGRAGGRINTVRGLDDIPLEMGATWFGNQHQNLKNLLEELSLPGFKQYSAGAVIFEASPLSPSQRIEIPPQDPSFRIVGGTGKIIHSLLKFFSAEEVHFNEQVGQIFIEEEQVTIKTKNSTFSASKLICCIPPALLAHTINFNPALPEAFLTEAKRTHTWMQESIKAAVVYKEPFWKDKKISTIVSNQGPVIEYYDHSDATNSKYALCGFLHPDCGDLDKEEREEKVIIQLKRLLGKEAGEYIGYEETVWQYEKYTNANTGEAFLPHQNNGSSIFKEPLFGGKVWVSNSETSAVYGGYMEGAVYAANQVAKKITEED